MAPSNKYIVSVTLCSYFVLGANIKYFPRKSFEVASSAQMI